MITPNGFSKDKGIRPEGIVVTCGAQMIEEKGGLRKFIKWFESCFEDDNGYWLHKCKNKPQHDIIYVYVIIHGKIKYRLSYGGYQRTAMAYSHPDAQEMTEVEWPHVVLGGPLVKAPRDFEFKGFQGFRYCTFLF